MSRTSPRQRSARSASPSRTRRAVAVGLLAAGATLVSSLATGCAATPQDSNTKNAIIPAPPFPEGVPSPAHYPLPGASLPQEPTTSTSSTP